MFKSMALSRRGGNTEILDLTDNYGHLFLFYKYSYLTHLVVTFK